MFIRNQRSRAAVDSKTERRQKLLRRLAWKAPVILLLVSFAVWWEWRKENAEPARTGAAAATLTGLWSGEVTYPWGEKYTEPFFFQPEGNKLFGTAGFLGRKRGIEEGGIEGNDVSFFIRFQEVSRDRSRERKNYYWGKLHGEEILIRMQDDRGNPPVEWVLTRSKPAE